MALLIVQLNHPGPQKKFKTFINSLNISKGYRRLSNGKIIREWNNDILPNDKRPHYRKFIKNAGEYIKDLNSKPIKCDLLFWGEWEGNSFFNVIGNGNGIPNGVHEPFHSTAIWGFQNTDPYIFGDFFKYAICSQNGVMNSLDNGSLILFGTTTKLGFLLDTVFVVKSHESANTVRSTAGSKYSQTYKEETLDQLLEYLKTPYSVNININLYRGQTYQECKDYFSFVPCRSEESVPFNKILLDFNSFPWLSKCTQGHPYKHLLIKDPLEIWNEIVSFLINKGFYLGIKFDEPASYSNTTLGLPVNSNVKTQNSNLRKSC